MVCAYALSHYFSKYHTPLQDKIFFFC